MREMRSHRLIIGPLTSMPTLPLKAFAMVYVVVIQQYVFMMDLSTPSVLRQSIGSPTYCLVVMMIQKVIKMMTVNE